VIELARSRNLAITLDLLALDQYNNDCAVDKAHINITKENTMFNTETKTYKLFTALHEGQAVTPSQAQKRFGIKNMSAEVSRIRQAGYAVYANKRRAGNGVAVTEYVIGKPSRKIVAAGYKAIALGLV
jgi:hypothetical protein